jgi:hypothetical protein
MSKRNILEELIKRKGGYVILISGHPSLPMSAITEGLRGVLEKNNIKNINSIKLKDATPDNDKGLNIICGKFIPKAADIPLHDLHFHIWTNLPQPECGEYGEQVKKGKSFNKSFKFRATDKETSETIQKRSTEIIKEMFEILITNVQNQLKEKI